MKNGSIYMLTLVSCIFSVQHDWIWLGIALLAQIMYLLWA